MPSSAATGSDRKVQGQGAPHLRTHAEQHVRLIRGDAVFDHGGCPLGVEPATASASPD
jgi:hypothetical protein